MMSLLMTWIAIFWTSFSSASSSQPTVLVETKSFREGGAFVTELKFNQNLNGLKPEVEYINQTVQVNIPGVTISKGKELNRLEDEKVQSIYTYQLKPDLMRTRIIYQKPIEVVNFKGNVETSITGSVLKVKVNEKSPSKAASSRKEVPILPPTDLNRDIDEAIRQAAEELSDEALIEKAQSILSESEIQLETGLDSKTMNENEIPVLMGAAEEKKARTNPLVRMLISLLIILTVAAAVVVGTRKWSKYNNPTGSQAKIKVLTQHSLGPKKNLAIIEVAGESMLIGITDHNISMIKSLSLLDEDIPDTVPQNFEAALGATQAEDAVGMELGEVRDRSSFTAKIEKKDDDFSITSVKDLVRNKIKEMRTL